MKVWFLLPVVFATIDSDSVGDFVDYAETASDAVASEEVSAVAEAENVVGTVTKAAGDLSPQFPVEEMTLVIAFITMVLVYLIRLIAAPGADKLPVLKWVALSLATLVYFTLVYTGNDKLLEALVETAKHGLTTGAASIGLWELTKSYFKRV